jgi:hypothetical protein
MKRQLVRMSARLRAAIYATFGALWASGCGWLVLHLFFRPVTEFGPGPHPWEPALMRLHGVLAVPGVFLLGWISTAHLVEHWRHGRRPISGITISATAALLVLSGYALYYVTGFAHSASSVTHEVIGVAAIATALIHWQRSNQRTG